MLEEIEKEIEDRMGKAFHHVQEKLKKVRTGSAHTSLLENVKISCYRGEQELKHIASISCPDSRSLLISPWDQSTLKDIEAALIKSDLGMAPRRSGNVIHLKVPELSEERRAELTRLFKKDVEKARIEFRQIRQMMNEKVKSALKEKVIGEDVAENCKKQIQQATDNYVNKVNDLSNKKQKELTEV